MGLGAMIRGGLMLPFRVVQAALYFANFFVLLYCVAGALSLIRAPRVQFYRLVRRAAYNTFKIFGIEYRIIRAGSLDPSKPYIYIANHRSWLDQPVVITCAPSLVHFLGKEAYFRIPFLSRTLRLFGCLPVKKGAASQLIPTLRECVRNGGSVVVYPEGTRATGNGFLGFRSGAFVLSAQTQVPIVPIYIYGADRVLPRGRSFLSVRPGVIRAVVGEPFVVPATQVDSDGVAAYRQKYLENFQAYRELHALEACLDSDAGVKLAEAAPGRKRQIG